MDLLEHVPVHRALLRGYGASCTSTNNENTVQFDLPELRGSHPIVTKDDDTTLTKSASRGFSVAGPGVNAFGWLK